MLSQSTNRGFAIERVDTRQIEHEIPGRPAVAVTMEVRGQPTVRALTVELNDLDGVLEVSAADLARTGD